jgi:hypothetical protein
VGPATPTTVSPPAASGVGFDELLAQFVEAPEDRVLWKQRFGEKLNVPWVDFKSFVTEHFKWNAQVVYRPLADGDLEIMKGMIEQRAAKDLVTLAAYGKFWPWFTQLTRTIFRLRPEWCQDRPRLIYGLISRGRADVMLKTSPPGTFMLRFSENNPGHLAIAHVDDSKEVVHTLVGIQQDGFTLPTPAGIYTFPSLADVILSCKPLRILYPDCDKSRAFAKPEYDDAPS